MIAKTLERRKNNVAKKIFFFFTRKRELKRALQVCLSCLSLVCGLCKMTSVTPYLKGKPAHYNAIKYLDIYNCRKF